MSNVRNVHPFDLDLNDEEVEILQKLASQQGVTVSKFVRSLIKSEYLKDLAKRNGR